MNKVIQVANLSKVFLVRKASEKKRAWRSLFASATQEMLAVDRLSFQVNPGERVAFIGPNGAGKSTTIKILTGILHPTAGCVDVMGFTPWKHRRQLGYKMGTVFGQRTQLWYHLPPSDTFFLLSKVYEIPPATYQKRLQSLSELFEIAPFLHKPVKQLSLGERMRCEIVASLLHHPPVLFLDEPTIGLDVNAKLRIRDLLSRLSREEGTTLFLTSHDMGDVEHICERVIILDKGSLLLDSSLRELKKTYIKKKNLTITTTKPVSVLEIPHAKVIKNEDHHWSYEIDLRETSIDQVVHHILQQVGIKDITIEDPAMEEIIRTVYGGSHRV